MRRTRRGGCWTTPRPRGTMDGRRGGRGHGRAPQMHATSFWSRSRPMQSNINRRRFMGSAVASGVLTIVPRHVLGGAGLRRPERQDHAGPHRHGHAGLPRTRRPARRAGDPDRRRLRPEHGQQRLRGVGQEQHPQHDPQRTWGSPRGERTTAAVPAAGRWAGKSWTPTTPTSGARRSSRRAPPMPTSASCWRRRRTWTPSRS